MLRFSRMTHFCVTAFSITLMTRTHLSLLLLPALALAPRPGSRANAQQAPIEVPGSSTQPDDAPKPLPDVNTLMRQVEANEHASEAIAKNYIYRTFRQTDTTELDGRVKKSESAEFEVFWVNGIRVSRRLKTDGKDISPEEAKKQNERIDKRIAEIKEKRAKAAESGSDSHGNDELSFARILELGAFSNERREIFRGRSTILVDYTGDPKAKTRNSFEGAFKELGGTVWVDEQDKAISHVEARFLNDFKLGGGLLFDIHKGTSFSSDFQKINDEVWFPSGYEGRGSARAMLFFNIHGRQFGRTFDYRKFKATSTVLPAYKEVDPATPEPAPTPPPDSNPKPAQTTPKPPMS